MAAIFAISMTMSSSMATDSGADHLDVTEAKIEMSTDFLDKVEIEVAGDIPLKDIGDAFGYVILTTGTHYAITTHGGGFDSESQTNPAPNACDEDVTVNCEEVYHGH